HVHDNTPPVPPFPTRRSSDLTDYDHTAFFVNTTNEHLDEAVDLVAGWMFTAAITPAEYRREYEVVQRELERDKGQPDDVFSELRSEEHTSELQSLRHLVCRLL